MGHHSPHDHDRRDRKVIATVACPVCGAPIGAPCRQHGTHTDRPLASRTHSERRKAWQLVRDGTIPRKD